MPNETKDIALEQSTPRPWNILTTREREEREQKLNEEIKQNGLRWKENLKQIKKLKESIQKLENQASRKISLLLEQQEKLQFNIKKTETELQQAYIKALGKKQEQKISPKSKRRINTQISGSQTLTPDAIRELKSVSQQVQHLNQSRERLTELEKQIERAKLDANQAVAYHQDLIEKVKRENAEIKEASLHKDLEKITTTLTTDQVSTLRKENGREWNKLEILANASILPLSTCIDIILLQLDALLTNSFEQQREPTFSERMNMYWRSFKNSILGMTI